MNIKINEIKMTPPYSIYPWPGYRGTRGYFAFNVSSPRVTGNDGGSAL